MDILAALKQAATKLERQLTGVQGAIAVLGGATKVTSRRRRRRGTGTRKKRVVSAALRAKLSQKAKERWARIKAAEKGKKSK
jgi:hypothetical protein